MATPPAGPDPDRLAYVDINVTWASTYMPRRWGRDPKGQRLICTVPTRHWKTTTFVTAQRTSGTVTPMLLDGSRVGNLSAARARPVLAPS